MLMEHRAGVILSSAFEMEEMPVSPPHREKQTAPPFRFSEDTNFYRTQPLLGFSSGLDISLGMGYTGVNNG